jgi:hypothetical protein
MQQLPPSRAPVPSAPRFYLTGRQPLSPGVILLAIVTALGALSGIVYGMSHTRHAVFASGASGAARAGGAPDDDKDDDPSRIDTIVLGDPSEAPVPGRHGDHVSPVHPFVVVRLPRFGDQVGLIPNTPAGRLLYSWLAAFNQANAPALGKALPTVASSSAAAGQLELRQQTGGFFLLSAKEVQPGVLVFRLRGQTPPAVEVLGTLLVRPASDPPAIGSFSLRAVPAPHPDSNPASPPLPGSTTR